MTSSSDVEIELRRVVDRLTSMPIAKAEGALDAAHETAALIVEQTRSLDPTIPADARLPRVAISGAGAQLAVVGADYLRAASSSPQADHSVVHEALVALRRSLP